MAGSWRPQIELWQLHGIGCGNDADTGSQQGFRQHQQILVASYQPICIGCQRGMDEFIVVRIAAK